MVVNPQDCAERTEAIVSSGHVPRLRRSAVQRRSMEILFSESPGNFSSAGIARLAAGGEEYHNNDRHPAARAKGKQCNIPSIGVAITLVELRLALLIMGVRGNNH